MIISVNKANRPVIFGGVALFLAFGFIGATVDFIIGSKGYVAIPCAGLGLFILVISQVIASIIRKREENNDFDDDQWDK